ncbi:MFS transporter [Asticcacaulis machinosus]|uniref:MFS transporter n=1 Tax=Asticcacaulis machinosus TaxID=2984211 RepID=A0ABT5HI16_9CAUL|nr:MFS transporter [Asticcacaulis machinosus]MDC7675877.1 MFS transporter [Asticcacaulis machinosus]
MTPSRSQPLSWAQVLALSAPTFAFAGFEGSVSIFLPTYLSTHIGLPLATIALLMLVIRLWDTLNDPLMGAVSDATRFRYGRRKLYIAAGLPLVLVGTGLVYFAPAGLPLWQMAAGLFALTAGWTMINVPHGAWALEIGQNPQERMKVFGLRTGAGLLAMPVFAFGPALLERLGHNNIAAQMNLIGGLILLVLPVTLIWMLWRTPDSNGTGRMDLRALRHSYGLAFSKRAYWPLASLFAGIGAYYAVDSGLYLFLVRYGMGLPEWGVSLLLVQTVCGLLGIVVWIRLHHRWDTVPTLKLVLGLQVFCSLVLMVLPKGELWPFVIYAIVRGLISGAAFTLLRALLGELLDREGVSNGRKAAGTFYGAFHLVLNLSAATTTFILFRLLGEAGFDPRQPITGDVQADAVRIAAVIGQLVPSVFMLWVVWRQLKSAA